MYAGQHEFSEVYFVLYFKLNTFLITTVIRN